MYGVKVTSTTLLEPDQQMYPMRPSHLVMKTEKEKIHRLN